MQLTVQKYDMTKELTFRAGVYLYQMALYPLN